MKQYVSNSRPLTVILPEPLERRTRAEAVFLRPVPMNSWIDDFFAEVIVIKGG